MGKSKQKKKRQCLFVVVGWFVFCDIAEPNLVMDSSLESTICVISISSSHKTFLRGESKFSLGNVNTDRLQIGKCDDLPDLSEYVR